MVALSNFDVRDEGLVRKAVSQSNVVINLIGAEYETPRFKFEDVHIAAARRIAEAAKAVGAERLVHISCLGASEDSPSRRLRTKVTRCTAQCDSVMVAVPYLCAQASKTLWHACAQSSGIAIASGT